MLICGRISFSGGLASGLLDEEGGRRFGGSKGTWVDTKVEPVGGQGEVRGKES